MISIKPKYMKVRELVAILQKCNQDSDVSLGWCDEHWDNPDNDYSIGVEEDEDTVMIATKSWFNCGEDEDE